MKKNYDHIVLISIDDLRGDSFGENQYQHLPFELRKGLDKKRGLLDDIAAKGIFFENCFTAAPFTTASHASIFTGSMPLHHGVFEYYNSDIKKKTIFQYANKIGYKTIFQNDFPVIFSDAIGFKRGIDDYFVEDEEGALNKIKLNINSKTLSFFHFGGVHYPYGFHSLKFGGNDYQNKVRRLEIEFGIVDKDNLPLDKFDEACRDRNDKELLFRYKRIIEYLYDSRNYARLTQLYFEGIDYFLENRFKKFINQLLSILSSKRNIVFIFSDHGEDWCDESHGHYKSLTPAVLHVPLIILGLDIVPGVFSSNIRTIDIGSTIMAIIRPQDHADTDGLALDVQCPEKWPDNLTSIAQIWLGTGKDALVTHINNAFEKGGFSQKMLTNKMGESIIEKNYQFVRYFNRQGKNEIEKIIKIFDGKTPDPKTIERLRKILETYNESALDFNCKEIADDRIRSQLRQYGYNI